MANPEVWPEKRKDTGLSERKARSLALGYVPEYWFNPSELDFFNRKFLELRIERCEKGETNSGEPAWVIDVMSFILGSPLEPAKGENVLPQKLYPLHVWREKQSGVDHVSLRKRVRNMQVNG